MGEPWRVPAAVDGERLDRALALIVGLSRSEVTGLIEAGRVRVGKRVVTSRSRRVHSGESVEIEGELPAGPGPLEAEPGVDVPVVWFDDQIVVVDKPAGLVVHPGAGNPTGTLVQGLLARFPDLALLDEDPTASTPTRRPGIVHRLDKGTSGLLVVARTPVARESLLRQISERRMGREYVALAEGVVDSDAGVVDAPLGRSNTDPTKIRVQAGGREARTHYAVVRRAAAPVAVTLLRCRLETGRTHQIRVHLASIGHPVVGDDRYGGRAAARWRPLPKGRPFLHAAALSVEHPLTGELLRFVSPLPGDLAVVLAGIDASWVGAL